mmetsp:Transcript_1277/g.1825  ORF Transcript_1277/g.1825 Transcript_1277/m.1825 type:complete len:281 (+) Transcript_1277:93-935(+)
MWFSFANLPFSAMASLLLFVSQENRCSAFSPCINRIVRTSFIMDKSNTVFPNNNNLLSISGNSPSSIQKITTSLAVYGGEVIEAPENFFTILGITIGTVFTVSRKMNRVVLENRAWENRLEDARFARLKEEEEAAISGGQVSAYTELDLRRMDAEASQSAYGPDAVEQKGRSRSGRTKTLERPENETDKNQSDRNTDSSNYIMTDEEISSFETEFGISYDPYYDEPYTKDELPDDIPFTVDKSYGDIRYENGEIFYADEENPGMYWRQGGKPRLKNIWDF